MSDDREDGRPGGTPAGSDDGQLPPELRGLDRELRSLRFEPREGLEDRVMARLSAESRREEHGVAGIGSAIRGRRAVQAAAALALVTALGLLARVGSDGGSTGPPAGGGPAPPAAHDGTPAGEDAFALRWGPDARVLALGPGSGDLRGSGGRELRCGTTGDRYRCAGSSRAARFAAATGPAVLRDFCCLDYDGGGLADDGVRVVAGDREAVASFWLYEDRDGTGSFSDGDLLRTVMDGQGGAEGASASALSGRSAGSVHRLDRCCAELDGGARSDDGLFVLAEGREQVVLAVLYEDVTGDGRLSRGDRLRALRTASVPRSASVP